jgi:hypothetical protein
MANAVALQGLTNGSLIAFFGDLLSNSPMNHFISTKTVSEQRLKVMIGVSESDSNRQCKSSQDNLASQVAALARTPTTEQQITLGPSTNIWKDCCDFSCISSYPRRRSLKAVRIALNHQDD